jgi:hypothetical protein
VFPHDLPQAHLQTELQTEPQGKMRLDEATTPHLQQLKFSGVLWWQHIWP